METISHERFGWPAGKRLLLICVFFLLATVTIAREYVVHYPDERHYTDGALEMLRTGDLLTPCQADGTPRFRKPVVAYWLVVWGFSVLDVSPFSARFSSIVFGLATILVSYATAKDIWRRSDVAILVAQIVACNPLVVLSATRSLPDMPLCFFVSLAVWGFLRIHVHRNFAATSFWLAYVGTGGAVATKGLPVLTLLAYFLIVYLWQATRISDLRRLLHFPSLIVGVCVAGWWYLAMFLFHGVEAWEIFWRDQVGDRLVTVMAQPLQNGVEGLLTLFVTGIPWLIPLMVCGPVKMIGSISDRDQQFGGAKYLVGWCLFYWFLTSFVTEYSHRYLLITAPSSCLLIGCWLANRSEIQLQKWMLLLSSVAAVVVLLLGITSITVAWQLRNQAGAVASLLTIGLMFAAIGCTLPKRDWIYRAQGLGMTLNAALAMLCVIASYFALPDQGAQIANQLIHLQSTRSERFVIWCKPALASKIRLNTRGKVDFRHVDAAESCPLPAKGERLISSSASQPPGQAVDEKFITLSTGYRSLKPVPFVSHLLSGNLRGYLGANQEHFCLYDFDGTEGGPVIARQSDSIEPPTSIR
ncbi:MAG: phospholipid carrier-dependent glycosyltransferase [Planctomycetota bacterium]|nr:phospholipid carrier-dependent glycosyltransferase [Planctomycetota bacterium]MDA1177624.1 phospholipid carrier-dependent glycosyltransferase [Planctomycetota bacterium]